MVKYQVIRGEIDRIRLEYEENRAFIDFDYEHIIVGITEENLDKLEKMIKVARENGQS